MVRLLIPLLVIITTGCAANGTASTPEPTQTLRALPQTPTSTSVEPVQTVAPVESVGPTPTPLSHSIEEGDTLLSVAIEYGVELADLLLANPGINPRFLVIGDRLTIPRSGAQGPVPSATPVPVLLSDVACYESISGDLRCLLTAGVFDDAAEGVVALITLADERGTALQTEPAFAPINLVLPGNQIPLMATFARPDSEFHFASVAPLSALRAGDIAARYAELTQQISSMSIASDGQTGTVSGRVEVLSEELRPEERVRIVVVAYGADELPVGYRSLDIEGGGSIFDFEAAVFSLGPSIERIEVLSEAAYLP